jgi:hypothetical protein
MHEVYIDGTKYVPAQFTHPANSRAIKIALLKIFWGDCLNDSDEELDEKWKDLVIKVTDNPRRTESSVCFTIDDLLSEISEVMREHVNTDNATKGHNSND